MSKIIEEIRNRFNGEYSDFPEGKYVTIALLREIQSETIFRTEGSGEGLNIERVKAGMENDEIISRVVIGKRKQIAVERRTGREYLRANKLLPDDSNSCTLNKNSPCGKCLDCMVYGYAVGGGGAQKSRIISDNSYSVLPANKVIGVKTFNALYDNGTMRDETGKASSSINEDEYVKPATLFIDMVTFKDLTFREFVYGMSNILRSRRYGAISTRMGKMKNHVISVAFSDCEMFSNLELTQMVYDNFKKEDMLEYPLNINSCVDYMKQSFKELKKDICGSVNELEQEEIEALNNYIKELFDGEDNNNQATMMFKEQSEKYGADKK